MHCIVLAWLPSKNLQPLNHIDSYSYCFMLAWANSLLVSWPWMGFLPSAAIHGFMKKKVLSMNK